MTAQNQTTVGYSGPERRAQQPSSVLNEAAIAATLALIGSMTAEELLAIQRAHAAQQPTGRKVLTPEERRQRKNEAQAKVRSTPEGRAKANEASRRSIAARKHAEAVKALIVERITTQKETKDRKSK